MKSILNLVDQDENDEKYISHIVITNPECPMKLSAREIIKREYVSSAVD